jgi:hypothetical protein
MSASYLGDWLPMDSAPKDGTKILVTLRPTGDGHWIAADSDPDAVVVYAEAELLSWMPMPTPLPKLRSTQVGKRHSALDDPDEIGGSGI